MDERDNDSIWLSSPELRGWVTFSAMIETFPTAIDAQLKRDGGVNRFEYMVLAMLSEEPDRQLPMSDLATSAFGSLSRLSHAVKRLEDRGWVERSPGKGGRRHNVVRLTEQGEAEMNRLAPTHVREVRRVLIDLLSAEELETLSELSRRILARTDPTLHAALDPILDKVAVRNKHPETTVEDAADPADRPA